MSGRRQRRRPAPADAGAAAVETVLVVPVLVVLLLFVVFVGRIGTVQQDVYAAARDASRAASVRDSPAAAAVDARATADATLAGRGLACAPLAVEVDAARFAPGGAVAVDVTCVVSLADVSRLGVPGSKTVTARSVSVIDTHRGTAP